MRCMVLVLAAACASSPPPRPTPGLMRFANRDPVTLVNDRKPTPAPPKVDPGLVEYYWGVDVVEPAKRALTATPPRPATNVNSIGDVPNSAWFTNRAPSPEQIRRGPGRGGPDRSEPWRVVGSKVGGAAIGITIEDARRDRYVIKFDERGHPETESAADVIVQRLTWAFGYNVPDNGVVTFRRDELVLDPNAEMRFRSGDKRKMTQADLEKYLGMVEKDRGGTFRALASKLIPGKIIGGVEPHGVREGDLNDRVPHELRRDLRGQRLLWALVDHVDIKSQNTLATYTEGNYVKWYMLDFGESLGVGVRTTGMHRLGYRKAYSLSSYAKALMTFGLVVEPWERDIEYPRLRGLGHFESAQFDPARWVANHQWTPFAVADRFDEFWAAEILMRFTRAHLEAAVAAGAYSDPRTAKYVVNTLVERQRKIGRYAFSRVAPLTRFEAREQSGGVEMCFDDLWLLHRYGTPGSTAYRARSFDHGGRALHAVDWRRAANARTCIAGLRPGASHDGYTIVEVELRRDGHVLPPIYVHVAKATIGLRVIGLERR